MTPTKSDDAITVRRTFMVAASILLVVGGFIAMAIVTAAVARPGHVVRSGDYGSVIAYSLAASIISNIVWLVSWTSSIKLGREGVVVRNMLVVHRIPWACIKEFRLYDGLEILLSNQKTVGSIQFGESLLGSITGYPSYRRSVKRMQGAQARFAPAIRGSTAEARVASSHFDIPYRQFIYWFIFYIVPPMIALIFKQANGA